jgi:hypothetical protein
MAAESIVHIEREAGALKVHTRRIFHPWQYTILAVLLICAAFLGPDVLAFVCIFFIAIFLLLLTTWREITTLVDERSRTVFQSRKGWIGPPKPRRYGFDEVADVVVTVSGDAGEMAVSLECRRGKSWRLSLHPGLLDDPEALKLGEEISRELGIRIQKRGHALRSG